LVQGVEKTSDGATRWSKKF